MRCIVPARIGSKRFPRKPLAKILGREMILHTLDRCLESRLEKSDICVATDSPEIASTVSILGIASIQIDGKCETGTDRIAAAVETWGSFSNKEFFLNIQGDEPVIDPGEINLFLDSICGAYDAYVGYAPIRNVEEFSSQKVPKFVVSELDELLFASRSAVPWGFCNSNVRSAFKQVCIYAFSVRALSYYGVVRPKSVNEIVEDIEIIRLLDKGLKVKCIKLSDNGSYPVDYESDIPVVEEILLSKYQKFRG